MRPRDGGTGSWPGEGYRAAGMCHDPAAGRKSPMPTASRSRSAGIRQKLDHPVIDSDGHMVEVLPVMFDYLKQVGGPDMADRTWKAFTGGSVGSWYELSPEQRRHHNVMRPAFW